MTSFDVKTSICYLLNQGKCDLLIQTYVLGSSLPIEQIYHDIFFLILMIAKILIDSATFTVYDYHRTNVIAETGDFPAHI